MLIPVIGLVGVNQRVFSGKHNVLFMGGFGAPLLRSLILIEFRYFSGWDLRWGLAWAVGVFLCWWGGVPHFPRRMSFANPSCVFGPSGRQIGSILRVLLGRLICIFSGGPSPPRFRDSILGSNFENLEDAIWALGWHSAHTFSIQ